MKYKYEFVNEETVEVEVSEEIMAVLMEEDRRTVASNKKETRRHVTIDHSIEEGWMSSSEMDPDFMVEKEIQEDFKKECQLMSIKALEQLTEEQKELVDAIYIKGMSETLYAEKIGVTQGAIAQRIMTIRKKLKKLL